MHAGHGGVHDVQPRRWLVVMTDHNPLEMKMTEHSAALCELLGGSGSTVPRSFLLLHHLALFMHMLAYM